MHVIRPHLLGMKDGMKVVRFVTHQVKQAISNRIRQDVEAIFRVPHQVTGQAKDRAVGCPLGLISHGSESILL